MKVEQQVVSLELAKKLKDAGYPQDDSYFYWYTHSLKVKPIKFVLTTAKFLNDYNLGIARCLEICPKRIYAAPSVAEMGEKLPKGRYPQIEVVAKPVDLLSNVWIIPPFPIAFEARNEADARAHCWLYLKKKN